VRNELLKVAWEKCDMDMKC